MTKRSILIIDDDEDMGDALFSFFDEGGYRVQWASSGKQGITFAHAEVPELILLDWQMPKMGGEQVLIELATLPLLKDIPVILMSANIAQIPTEYLKTRKYLGKPFDLNVLIGLVAQALEE